MVRLSRGLCSVSFLGRIESGERGAEEIKLDVTICYYEKPEDWIPEKIFWRGTPSYQRDWRVAIPFVHRKEWEEGIEPEYEICYIRTSDIKKLFSSSGEGGDIGLDRRNRLEPSSEVL